MDALAMAKALIPKGSKLSKAVEQAEKAMSQFDHSENGVDQVLSQYGASRKDIAGALDLLNSNRVSSYVDRFLPGKRSELTSIGKRLIGDDRPESQPTRQANNPSNSTLDALRARASKL